jgi:hypothetical protein
VALSCHFIAGNAMSTVVCKLVELAIHAPTNSIILIFAPKAVIRLRSALQDKLDAPNMLTAQQ